MAGPFQLAEALLVSERIVGILGPSCERIEVAGSIRRRRPFVGDIDLVILPKEGLREEIVARAKRETKLVKEGEQYVVVEEMGTGRQIDLWFARQARPARTDMFGVVEQAASPSNWGILLLCRTGSAAHNVFLASRAKSLGLHFAPHDGIMMSGKVLASESEEEVFKALRLDYVSPERRER